MTDDIDRQALEAWIRAVRAGGEYRSVRRWVQAAGVPGPTVGAFLNGDHKSISKASLAKLAKVTRVPFPVAGKKDR
jgi:hypothetical protein